jgi:hypothetical protein
VIEFMIFHGCKSFLVKDNERSFLYNTVLTEFENMKICKAAIDAHAIKHDKGGSAVTLCFATSLVGIIGAFGYPNL